MKELEKRLPKEKEIYWFIINIIVSGRVMVGDVVRRRLVE